MKKIIMYGVIFVVPGLLYLRGDEFFYLSIAILYTFLQLILSDSFLSTYNITVNNKKELQRSRLGIGNISISILIAKLIFSLVQGSSILDRFARYNTTNHFEFILSHFSQIFLIYFLAMIILAALEKLEEIIAKKYVNSKNNQSNV